MTSEASEKALDLSTKRVALWTAIVVCVTAMVGTTAKVLASVQPTRTTSDSKPLEGEWDFFIAYDKFHDQEGHWSGEGRALLVWKRDHQQYELWRASSTYLSGSQRAIVTSFAHGYIAADENGWPGTSFEVSDVKNLYRQHIDNVEPTARQFAYTACRVERKATRADLITCQLDTGKSHAVVRFKWRGALH